MIKEINKLGKIIVLGTVISLSLVGCKGNTEGKDINDLNNTIEVIGENEETDENTGLIYESTMELKYAEHFSVDYYKDGYKIITDASDRKVLIVPEGKEAPEMKEPMPVIKQPIETFGIYSTIDSAWLRPIGELDRIAAVTYDIDSWRIPEVVEKMKNGDIIFIGRKQAIDYELLQSVDPSVNLLSKTGEEDLFPKYDELGLDYISMGAYLEDDPRGRLEWVKFTSALLNKEEEGDKFFEGELARIDEIAKKILESTEERLNIAIVYFSPSKEMFYVNNRKGHKGETTELAGGQPFPADLNPEKRGNTPMTDEEFYKVMSDVDILIYDNITGHEIQTIEDMVKNADYLKDTKVIQEGRVWGLQRDYWQSADKVADIIENLHEIITTPHGEITENGYYYLMK